MASRIDVQPQPTLDRDHLPAYQKPTRMQMLLRNIWRERIIYLLILPGALWFLIFNYLPLIGNVVAFQDYSPFRASKEGPIAGFFVGPWTGLDNFTRLFHDPDFLRALSNTVKIEVLLLVFSFPAPLLLALLLNSLISDKVKRSMQTVVYLPHFLSWVIIISMWRMFFGGTGLVNNLLSQIGGPTLSITDNPDFFKVAIVMQSIWKDVGWGTIIYLAALASIDVSLYEAAAMDGANGWRRLRDVTLPGIRSVVVILLILTLGNALSVGFEPYFLQRDAYSAAQTDVLDTFQYFRGFQAGDYGFATAVGLVKSFVGLGLIYGANLFAKRIGEEGII
ncbi:MAG: ABC transporter permease subunit [Thermomicrobiales bacterium]